MSDKITTARRLGYGEDIEALDMDHDALHGAVCHFLGVPSYALKEARGEVLSAREQRLAWLEEDAVLAVQQLRQMHRVL